MTRPDVCTNSETLSTGALFCTRCWRYKLRPRCSEFKEHGVRLVAEPGKKPFGVKYKMDRP